MRSKQGLLFWADPASMFGFEMLYKKVYEPQMTKLFELVLRPTDTLIDVGGGEGYFSILGS